MFKFYAATLLPAVILVLALVWAGGWAILALLMAPCLYPALDLATRTLPTHRDGEEFPAPYRLNIVLGMVHFILLIATIVVVGLERHGLGETLAIVIAVANYFGLISNANAHELIHRPDRFSHTLGRYVYTSLLNGHHTSAHVLVHHVHVATPRDPNSARKGESVWRFVPRAYFGSFSRGYEAEVARTERAGRSVWRNPYYRYMLGAFLWLLIARLLGGHAGLYAYLFLAIFATIQIYVTDYVQHYGLQRKLSETGKPEPVGVRHSWNAQSWFTSKLLVNAPRHSDHHMNPTRAFPALKLPEKPMLPYGLPVMASIAIIPPLWRRMMHPRLKPFETHT